MNLKLTVFGLSGVGKSTIGKLIAKEYNIPCIDIDAIIEEKYGIDKIFKEYGEQEFRTIETYFLQSLAEENALKSHVLIGGAGIVESKFNRDILKNYFSIYLEISPKSVPKLDNRPLLKKETLAEQLKRRECFYKQADLIVNVDRKSIKEIVNHVKGCIEGASIFN